MTPEERKALMDEIIEKAKAAFVKEAQGDIDKINKLIADERKALDLSLAGKLTAGDFKTYEEKSQAAEAAFKARIDEMETKMNRLPLEDPEKKGTVIEGAPEYKAAFYNMVRTGRLVLDDKAAKYIEERKALVSDATGQILIPEDLETEIYRALPNLNVIRTLATIRGTRSDRIRRRSLTEVEMGWGKLELGKEVVETDVTPSEAWQYVEDLEGLAKIGKDELADSDVALESIILDSFSRARARKEETGFVVGTGHGFEQPEGILNGTTITRVTTAAADAIAADDFLDLIYAVPAQYRRNGKIFVPSTTELAMRKLKSAVELLYLWQPNVQAGQPATFAGYPVISQEDIPAIGSSGSCDVAFFGDIQAGYRVVDRAGMTVQRLVELFTTSGMIGILVSARCTGGIIRPDALRVLREHA